MSYIIKNSGQGQLVARLTDAGRKKLSEGNLNIELFQIGDSEMCYDCYTNLPNESYGQNILQAEHNAQNLNPCPAENKGHIKYPLVEGTALSGNTFGPTIFVGGPESVFNTAIPRGFFFNTGTTYSTFNAGYESFSAYTDGGVLTPHAPGHVLTSNWCFPVSAMTGGSAMRIFSANTNCAGMMYTPQTGDLVSVTYDLTKSDCSQITFSSASPTLFYQVVYNHSSGLGTGQTTTNNVELGVDRNVPNIAGGVATGGFADKWYSAFTGSCVYIKVYPSYTGLTGMRTYYGLDTPVGYWCTDTLSFDNCCDISNNDVNVWNMNINWTHTVAGTPAAYFDVDDYGSSGYSGTKEFLQYEGIDGGVYTDIMTDAYDPSVIGGTWYLDSFNNERVVVPEEQKCIAIIHYTNEATTDFYGEKFAMNPLNTIPATTVGEAQNFKIHMPSLMWHRKRTTTGTETGTGQGNEIAYGQTFYVDPPVLSYTFPSTCPPYLQSLKNSNMNDPGLRYYHLVDDIVKPIYSAGTATGGPMRVGKVFPDLKMAVIDDQELVAAMSYKSNRNWTLPAPKIECIPPATNCNGPGCSTGIFTNVNETLWLTYLLTSSSGFTSGLHCNYYVTYTREQGDPNCDISVQWGAEFPYLRDFTQAQLAGNFTGGTGFQADGLYLLAQVQPSGVQPVPTSWSQINITGHIPGHTVGTPIDATQLTQSNATFFVTGVHLNPSCGNYSSQTTYDLSQYIGIPSATTQTTHNALNFGDEYALFGTLESDIMATIYEMKHQVVLGTNQYLTTTNPSYTRYVNTNAINPTVKVTELGLFDNENGVPDLMAIAKMQNPTPRVGNQQFVINIDF